MLARHPRITPSSHVGGHAVSPREYRGRVMKLYQQYPASSLGLREIPAVMRIISYKVLPALMKTLRTAPPPKLFE